MRRRAVLALGGSTALAAIVTTTTLAIGGPADASAARRPAPAAVHVLVLRERLAGKPIDKGPLLIQADNGYHGKAEVSADVIDCHFGKTSAVCQVALAIGPGLLYGHFTETPDNKISGVITGGTGALKHASGTIKGRGTVTVKYRA